MLPASVPRCRPLATEDVSAADILVVGSRGLWALRASEPTSLPDITEELSEWPVVKPARGAVRCTPRHRASGSARSLSRLMLCWVPRHVHTHACMHPTTMHPTKIMSQMRSNPAGSQGSSLARLCSMARAGTYAADAEALGGDALGTAAAAAAVAAAEAEVAADVDAASSVHGGSSGPGESALAAPVAATAAAAMDQAAPADRRQAGSAAGQAGLAPHSPARAGGSSYTPLVAAAEAGLPMTPAATGAAAEEAAAAAAGGAADLAGASKAAGRPGPAAGEAGGQLAPEGEEEPEGREYGHVKWAVWGAYLRAVGWGMVAAVLVSLVLMQVRGGRPAPGGGGGGANGAWVAAVPWAAGCSCRCLP